MTAALSPTPKLQFFDANGNPLVGGKVYSYAAGTTTPLATYTDATGTTPAANPIILNGRGETSLWLGDAAYKLKLATAADVEVWTVDNVVADVDFTISTNATGNGTQTIFSLSSKPTAVFVNGVYQNRNTYTYASGAVTFSQAPPVTSTIEFVL